MPGRCGSHREQLKQAGAIEGLFRRFDEVLDSKGYVAMGRQIIDASLIAAPRQKFSQEEKATIRDGGTPEGWFRAKRAQNDRMPRQGQAQARWGTSPSHPDRGAALWLQKPYRH
jgi:hypothetical protein